MWIKLFSKTKNKHYFYNRETRETTWTPPGPTTPPSSPPTSPLFLTNEIDSVATKSTKRLHEDM